MSIEKKLIEEEFERLEILPEKSIEKVSENRSLINPMQSIQEYHDTGSELKELKNLERRIKTGIKRMIISENSIQGAYIEIKDYFAAKFYGRVTTMEDLFSNLSYVLTVMGNNLESAIKRGDKKIDDLDQYYYSLRKQNNENRYNLNHSRKRLEDMKTLALKIEPMSNQARSYEEREDYLIKKRELIRKICREEFNINSFQNDIARVGKSIPTSDLMVRFLETVNFASEELLKENRHYIGFMSATIMPYLHFIGTSKRHSEMVKVEEDINKLTSRTHELFREGAKNIAEAYNKIGTSGISDRYILSINNGLNSRGYLED